MILSQQSLMTALQQSVVELRFGRRREKRGWSPYRRALVTNNIQMLNSAPGQLALHFKPPSHPPAYPWVQKNLVCCWDIMWQDWRMIPVESTDVITMIPIQNQEEIDKWWAYFSLFLENLGPHDKVAFMNK